MQNDKFTSAKANQYPHRKNYFTRFIRSFLSWAPHFGIISSSSRPNGISILMRVKDEADWIKPSIESIKRIADEIIIADNGSSDGTHEILKNIADREKQLIKLWQKPELQHCDLTNFALEKTSYRWIFRWDGDMIAHTSGKFDIANLRKRILLLNPRYYYLIYLRHINLAGDLFHQNPDELVHIEEYIHTYSKSARYIHPSRFEAIKLPKYYKVLFWYEPYSFHINVKPKRKMLLRYFWEEWMEIKDYQKYPSLDDYVNTHMEREFGTKSWEEAEQICVQKILSNLTPYDQNTFGPYPELLKEHIESPKYKMVFDNGKIIGRQES